MSLASSLLSAHRARRLPLSILLVATLSGCPYIGPGTHNDNVDDSDTDVVVDPDTDSDPDTTAVIDADDDGVPAEDDCDDTNSNVYPGNAEQCDGIDNDCDTLVDEDFPPLYLDVDNDGFGGPSTDICSTSAQATTVSGDCDDTKPEAYPGNPEVCDGVDNDCNTFVDDGFPDRWTDLDRDGYGVVLMTDCADTRPSADNDDDCDDTKNEVFPGNPEVCDGLDNDCNDLVDDGLPTRYLDLDLDGVGGALVQDCAETRPTAAINGDCDDADGTRYPGNLEVCDQVDNDCHFETQDAGLASFYAADGSAAFNLDTLNPNNTSLGAGEVRFCTGNFDMTFQIQNVTERLLFSGLGVVVISPARDEERVFYIENSTVELNNITVANGDYPFGGGGMFCGDSTVTLNSVRFRDNTSNTGGGLLASNCTLNGGDASFLDNTATVAGGAIVQLDGSSADWTTPRWSSNMADRSLVINDSAVTLTSVLFSDSTDVAILLNGESTVSIENGNFGANEGVDLQFNDSSSINLGTDATLTCFSPNNGCVAR